MSRRRSRPEQKPRLELARLFSFLEVVIATDRPFHHGNLIWQPLGDTVGYRHSPHQRLRFLGELDGYLARGKVSP